MDAEDVAFSLIIGHRRSSTSTAAFTGGVFWTSTGEMQNFSRYSARHRHERGSYFQQSCKQPRQLLLYHDLRRDAQGACSCTCSTMHSSAIIAAHTRPI